MFTVVSGVGSSIACASRAVVAERLVLTWRRLAVSFNQRLDVPVAQVLLSSPPTSILQFLVSLRPEPWYLTPEALIIFSATHHVALIVLFLHPTSSKTRHATYDVYGHHR
ncbi:hypothetical protein GALMADRAFT_1124058 [Galerina marginata CBS 339.88]|uniref:Uncharacterized protein n=1 Tax=Galerina marginata (strain CBS 339.88) TaxID=685588 RepID=A0A067TMQ1_GALM3|nr:hypothetical protein GALMADRAFT_1124058 [Galerina marginata CBS 339.88]